ncbi:MAG TPA: hemerythrin domain-containing protein [Labilithrix sp.]|nr:hemerythrin domain-containing protein [Labilithrix sp.]
MASSPQLDAPTARDAADRDPQAAAAGVLGAVGVTSGSIGAGRKEGFAAPVTESASLRADHDLLETLAKGIIDTIVSGEQADVSDAVTALQSSVGTHLDGEERDLLPRYAEHDPADAARIMEEHAVIRRKLADLDVTTDLHLVRADAMRALLESLSAHAARENAGLYTWAAKQPAPSP